MFIGILEGDVVPPGDTSCGWSGSYGWTFGDAINRGSWKNGTYTEDNILGSLLKQGDAVSLILDCDSAKLSLHLANNQQFYIDIPENKTWRLNVDMSGANDKIRIIKEQSN